MLRDEVISAKIPGELGQELRLASRRIERSMTWIIREALTDWLAEQALRDQLELDASEYVDLIRAIPQPDLWERFTTETLRKIEKG